MTTRGPWSSCIAERGGRLRQIEKVERALRERSRKEIDSERRAAVSIILRERSRSRTEILLIERTSRPDDPWSGQMAFPGGRIEELDESELVAALREAREEIGLDLESTARLLGASDDLRAMAGGRTLNLVITPFVFELVADIPELTLQEEEVASVLWAPLEELYSGRLDGTYTHERPGKGRVKLPCYNVGGKVVWGLTYMMLRNVFTIVRAAL